jgi:hypothetical protein
MDAHTLPCDCCGDRFDDAELEYIEDRNEYLCQNCILNLATDEDDEDPHDY